MKIGIVPDVHGRTFWKNLNIDEYDKVVFLGDYLDPYPVEGITPEDAIHNFLEIIKLKKDNPDKIILLLGNHCYPYYAIDERAYVSRHDYSNEGTIECIFKENKELFQLYYKWDKFLFTHAGITNDWLTLFPQCKNIDEFLKLSIEEIIPNLWVFSQIRGGWRKTGSMIWHDVRELDLENTYYQIFGHTQMTVPYFSKNYACLDCRQCFELVNGKINAIISSN